MDHNNLPAPDAAFVMELLGSLMARLIERDVIDLQDAIDIERRVTDARLRASH